MTLVTHQSGVESKEHLRVLVAGRPGSGLSSLAVSWPQPYYLLFGGDLTWIDADLAYARIASIDDLMAAIGALSGSPEDRAAHMGVRVSTVVVDTLDGLEHLVGDDPRKMRKLIETLAALPLHVVLLCHVRHAGAFRMEPAVCIPDEVATYVDMALYLGTQATHMVVRYVRAWPSTEVPWVVDRSGQLPAETVIQRVDFAFLADAAGLGSAPSAAPAAVQPAAPPKAAVAKKAPPPPAPAPVVEVQPEADDGDGDEPDGDEPDGDDDGGADLPMCDSQGAQGNDCLGRVESQDSLDLSKVRFNRPMCGPCGKAEYEAMPKVLPRKARPAPTKAAAPPPRSDSQREPIPEAGALPRGEIVGRIRPTEDKALRDLLAT